jgi:lipoprotein-releasing system permease protein
MFLSIAIAWGFKNEIRNKVRGFASDIVVNNYDNNYSYETRPIEINKEDIKAIKKINNVKNIQFYATKPGIIKSKNLLHGAILKGIYKEYDLSFLKQNLVEGKLISLPDSGKSNEIIISKKISQTLQLKVGDPVYMFFIQDPPKMRKFYICGIYETMMEDFDNIFIYTDIRQIQKLNDWKANQVSGYEINLKNFDSIPYVKQKIYSIVGTKFFKDGTKLKVSSIQERYPYVFDWINLFNTNLWVILVLMMLISGFNIISGLLVLILERVNMIGILKTLGFFDSNIRKIFIYISLTYVIIGLILGNIFSFALYYLQKNYHIVALNKASYYIDYVPVQIEWWHILSLNLAIVIITFIILLIPSELVSKIEPVKAIKFN